MVFHSDCITMSARSTVHFGCLTTIGSERRSRTLLCNHVRTRMHSPQTSDVINQGNYGHCRWIGKRTYCVFQSRECQLDVIGVEGCTGKVPERFHYGPLGKYFLGEYGITHSPCVASARSCLDRSCWRAEYEHELVFHARAPIRPQGIRLSALAFRAC